MLSTRPLLAVCAWQVPLALVLAFAAVQVVGFRPELAVFLYLAVATPELCRIDFLEHRLPNAIVLPAGAVALLGLGAAWADTGQPPVVPLVAGAAALAFLLVLNLAGGLGMGDVKLGGVMGLALGSLGAVAPIVGLVLAFVAGGVAGFLALLAPAASGLRRIPFGPFLLLGFWSAAIADPVLVV
jgi:leader peptidase (prepilin peptidase)/N-methyltransferase